jgi:hypothetical protein
MLGHLNGTVTMMHVPINYHNALYAMPLLNNFCGHSHVVEKTEPGACACASTVSRWPYASKSIQNDGSWVYDLGGKLNSATCNELGRFWRASVSKGIPIDRSGRWPQGTMPVSGMPWGAPGGNAGWRHALGIGSSVAGSASVAPSWALIALFQPLAAVTSGQVMGPVRFLCASPLGAPTTSDQQHGIWSLVRFRAQCASSARRHLARQRPLHRLHGIYSTSPADRVLRVQLLRLSPPRLPLLPLRTSVTPRAFDNRRQSFRLRTAVRTRFLNARRWRSSHQDLGINFQSFLLVVGHHIAIDFSPPTSHVFAHAALGPRHHR